MQCKKLSGRVGVVTRDVTTPEVRRLPEDGGSAPSYGVNACR